MTWTEAQTYCREVYTDLATIENMEEMEQLISTVPSLYQNYLTWIGMYSKITWKWSDGYNGSGADFRNWEAKKEPDFHGNQFCVAIEDDGRWLYYECSSKIQFICYRGTQQDPEFVHVNERLDWSNAQRYCREKFLDLATVRNDIENQKIHKLRPSKWGLTKDWAWSKDWAWIGLYKDPDSYWSDGSDSSFRFWDGGSNLLASMSVICGAVDLQLSGKWRPVSCEKRFPFVCYNSGKCLTCALV
nr:secretory phospholipase A2 receptor-like [Labrus bergylta]